MRNFLYGLLAIAVAGGAILLGIALATAPGPSVPPRPSAEVAGPPAPFSPPLSVQEAIRLAPAAPQQPSPIPLGEVSPPRAAPAPGTWEAVPLAARPSALGPVGGAVGRGLNNLADDLAVCFEEETQARFGQTTYTSVMDDAPMDERGTTVLVLQIESGGGRARIVDAPVETRGGASDGLIACAQQLLRGKSFEVPEARRNERHRVLFPLQQ